MTALGSHPCHKPVQLGLSLILQRENIPSLGPAESGSVARSVLLPLLRQQQALVWSPLVMGRTQAVLAAPVGSVAAGLSLSSRPEPFVSV